MTYRVALHAAAGWQIISSALVMTLVIRALIRIGGRIYTGALLRYGGRVPLRDIWHSTNA
jgi:ABC-2 type transport system permease protein